jgi:sortase A
MTEKSQMTDPSVTERPIVLSIPTIGRSDRYRLLGTALTVFGAILLGFVLQVTALSQVVQARDQQLLIDTFRYQLANATAPIGPVGPDGRLIQQGSPVALVEIPSIHLRQVIVEGTTSDDTRSAPGHRRDTVLPGQPGASVIFGRQTAYGGPFGSIGQITVGDLIDVVTGQGTSVYRVVDVRFSGDPLPATLNAGQSRLTLVSASGLPLMPDRIVRVDALLLTAAHESPGRVLGFAALDDTELAMAPDHGALPTLVLSLLLLTVAVVVITLSRRYWGRWQTWIVGVPVLFALSSLAATNAALLLPNLI